MGARANPRAITNQARLRRRDGEPRLDTAGQPVHRLHPADLSEPKLNSLVDDAGFVMLDGKAVNISDQVAYTSAYHNHPSEPDYISAEAGANFGISNDADPYPNTNQNTTAHLATLLTAAGKTWR